MGNQARPGILPGEMGQIGRPMGPVFGQPAGTGKQSGAKIGTAPGLGSPTAPGSYMPGPGPMGGAGMSPISADQMRILQQIMSSGVGPQGGAGWAAQLARSSAMPQGPMGGYGWARQMAQNQSPMGVNFGKAGGQPGSM